MRKTLKKLAAAFGLSLACGLVMASAVATIPTYGMSPVLDEDQTVGDLDCVSRQVFDEDVYDINSQYQGYEVDTNKYVVNVCAYPITVYLCYIDNPSGYQCTFSSSTQPGEPIILYSTIPGESIHFIVCRQPSGTRCNDIGVGWSASVVGMQRGATPPTWYE